MNEKKDGHAKQILPSPSVEHEGGDFARRGTLYIVQDINGGEYEETLCIKFDTGIRVYYRPEEGRYIPLSVREGM